MGRSPLSDWLQAGIRSSDYVRTLLTFRHPSHYFDSGKSIIEPIDNLASYSYITSLSSYYEKEVTHGTQSPHLRFR